MKNPPKRALTFSRHSPLSPLALLRAVPRLRDDLPLWAQLNVTWQCNLSCAYCVEYDNHRPHVPLRELQRRIDHCAELGVRMIGLIGGEPLLHPDLVEIVAHIRKRGMATGLTTNGFLISKQKMDALVAAGMSWVQLSIDKLHPSTGIPKSLKTLAGRLELLATYPILLRVMAVLGADTLTEVQDVAEFCFARGIDITFAVQQHHGRIEDVPCREQILEKLAWLKRCKQAGKPVAMPYYLLDYFERVLRGERYEWTCLGGSKSLYVSSDGELQPCTHVPSKRAFLDVTREELSQNRSKKGCEEGCGVDCMIETSLPYNDLFGVLGVEFRERLAGFLSRDEQRKLAS